MIAILGAGDFGMAMAHALSRGGYPFRFGVRDAQAVGETVRDLQRIGSLESCHGAMNVAGAVEDSELVILAVPYAAALALAASVGDWGNRILIDCTNPLTAGLRGLEVGHTSSAAEEIARSATNARVVKGFSTLSAFVLEHPTFGTGRAFLPICGDDADARSKVIEIGRVMGYDVVDVWPLRHARYIEPFAMLGIQLAVQRRYGQGFALGALQRERVAV